MFKELKEFEARHYAVAVSTLLASIGPGLLCIYHYRPELITALDAFKLILLSAGLALPVCGANFLVGAATSEEKDDAAIIWLSSTSVTSAILYLSMYIAYLAAMPFRKFTYTVLALEILLVIETLIEAIISWRKKQVGPTKAVEPAA